MKILVGVDGSPPSHTALDLIAGISWPPDARFTFLTTAEGEAPADVLRALDVMAEPLRRQGHPVEPRLEHGHAGQCLRGAAAADASDLLVVGSRGRGVAASAVLGSVSAYLADHAPCPVLVARQPDLKEVLIATDGSAAAIAIPSILRQWRLLRGLPIHVLSVAPRAGGQEASEEYRLFAAQAAARLSAGGWRATPVVRSGEPAREIVRGAEELGCDLVVTGSRGLGDVQRRLMGSVAHDVLLHSHCSVLILRGLVPAPATREMATLPVARSTTA